MAVVLCVSAGCPTKTETSAPGTAAPPPSNVTLLLLLVVDDPPMAAAIDQLKGDWKSRTGAALEASASDHRGVAVGGRGRSAPPMR